MKKKKEVAISQVQSLDFYEKEFKLLPFENKAGLFCELLVERKKIDEVVKLVDAHLRSEFKGMQVSDKPARYVHNDFYELYQGSGFEDKHLGKADVEKFCKELHEIDPKAYADIVEMVPSVKKKELNKYRTMIGKTADLINRYCSTLNPKRIELREVEK